MEVWSIARLLDGTLARRVESTVAKSSRVAKLVRPYWNTVLYLALDVTTHRVVKGREGWLYLSTDVRDYPSLKARLRSPEIAAMICRFLSWLHEQGTEVLVVVVPNKETIYPYYLPPARPTFQPVYDEVLQALRDEGIWTLDLRPALEVGGAELYMRADTHWSSAGAELSARAVAAEVHRRFPEAPGRPIAARLWRTPDRLHAADMAEMLSVVPSISGGLQQCEARLYGVDEKGKVVESDGPEPIALAGTSFSDTGALASLLSVSLGRVVEDRSGSGGGPTSAILTVAESIARGDRPPPRLLIWEFPERYFYVAQFRFEALPAFVDELAVEGGGPGFHFDIPYQRE